MHFPILLPLNPHLLTPGVPSTPPESLNQPAPQPLFEGLGLCTSQYWPQSLNWVLNTGSATLLGSVEGPAIWGNLVGPPWAVGWRRSLFCNSYHRLEVSILKPFHLEIWVYKVELIDELIISTDTNLAAAEAIQGPSVGAMR